MNWRLLQQHTIDIYGLKDKSFVIQRVPARSLLQVSRFDLFAKLYYISNRKTNPEIAREVYSDHIHAFNPDGKEPGRTDKNGVGDFIVAFDKLIDYFKDKDFDESISLVPVGSSGEILDGSHRVAALAYYDKEVSIAKFDDVNPKCIFDYQYFFKRGLPWKTADIIALEALRWNKELYVGCLWPRINSEQKRNAISIVNSSCEVYYSREIHVSLKQLSLLIANIYRSQDWVGNEANGYAGAYNKALSCFGPSKQVQFVFFQGRGLDETLAMKERIRQLFPYDKHSLHISDTDEETEEISRLVLTDEGRSSWQGNRAEGLSFKIKEWLCEKCEFFKNVTIINWKVKVYKLLKGK